MWAAGRSIKSCRAILTELSQSARGGRIDAGGRTQPVLGDASGAGSAEIAETESQRDEGGARADAELVAHLLDVGAYGGLADVQPLGDR